MRSMLPYSYGPWHGSTVAETILRPALDPLLHHFRTHYPQPLTTYGMVRLALGGIGNPFHTGRLHDRRDHRVF